MGNFVAETFAGPTWTKCSCDHFSDLFLILFYREAQLELGFRSLISVRHDDKKAPPDFLNLIPIRKTRSGLQFTCAAPTLGLNAHKLKDVWVCNSDGYVGQVSEYLFWLSVWKPLQSDSKLSPLIFLLFQQGLRAEFVTRAHCHLLQWSVQCSHSFNCIRAIST